MSLFVCQNCGCVENTALGHYWGQEKKLCSECGRGKWHGRFPKRKLDSEKEVVVEGFVHEKSK